MADVLLGARPVARSSRWRSRCCSPEFATDPNFVERFRREAQSAANLELIPNIVSRLRLGQVRQTRTSWRWSTSQGRTLADILRANGHISLGAGRRDRQRGRRCTRPSLTASGVVHRDIKPANILIGANGQVKVADFGIARAMNCGEPRTTSPRSVSVMGTATYFSPEQAQGAQPDPRSDLYSLGIVHVRDGRQVKPPVLRRESGEPSRTSRCTMTFPNR